MNINKISRIYNYNNSSKYYLKIIDNNMSYKINNTKLCKNEIKLLINKLNIKYYYNYNIITKIINTDLCKLIIKY